MRGPIVSLIVVLLVFSAFSHFSRAEDYWIKITINSDGSVTPSTAPVTKVGTTYILTSDLVGSIVVLKDHIELDGANHLVYGAGARYGIEVTGRTNVTIHGFQLQGFAYGIWLYESSNCTVEQNSVTDNEWNAINLYYSNNCTVSSNIAFNSTFGIWVVYSAHNLISNNCMSLGTFAYHGYGLYIDHGAYDNIFAKNNATGVTFGVYMAPYSFNNSLIESNIDSIHVNRAENNTIVHNNFSGNLSYVYGSPKNTWDNGKEGNFWGNYNGTDANHDGIGDTPYLLNSNNIDNYPLMQPYVSGFGDFNKDGAVNNQDIIFLVLEYIKYWNGESWNPAVDFNHDNAVNSQDITAFVFAYISYWNSVT